MNIIAPPSKPPIAVSAAVALHAASFAIGFINLLLSIGLHTAGRAIAWLIALGIIYIYLSAIYKGRNWVRWLSIVLSIAGIAGMPWTLPLRPTLVDKEVYVVQAILIGAASVLLLLPAAGQWFRPNNSFSASVQLKHDHELIQTGPYRFVRHPIYTGFLLLFLGSAVMIGEWRGLLSVAIVFVSFWRKLRLEENWLGQHFGPAYQAYRQRTKALIPAVL